MQREPSSDLFSSFGPRARLVQLRRLVQDAIDVFEGLVMGRPERYRDGLEVRVDGAAGPAVRMVPEEAPAEITLPDVHHTALRGA